MKKRVLSLFLACMMIFSVLPVSAWAAGEEEITVEEAELSAPAAEPQELPAEEDSGEPSEEETLEAPSEEEVSAEVPEEEPLTVAPEETVSQVAAADEVLEAVAEEELPILTVPGETQTVPVDGDTDYEALLTAYAQQQLDSLFPRRSSAKGAKNAGAKLTGLDAEIYRALKAEIQKVAAGERSSTEFSFTPEELGITKTSWTGEELGTAIVVNGSISQAAMTAAMATMPYSMGDIVHALLADCPYELYWFDKTVGYSYGYPGFGASGSGGAYTLYLDGSFVFRFAVAQEYSAGDCTVSTPQGASVTAAVNKAASIVADYSGRSDLAKLTGYKDEICALTSYNHSAADDSTNTPYGNPWQLIWVFDGLAATEVVCEGYSKAFQYLCDLTSFQRNITAYTVTGYMGGGTGAGGHMWNIVTMENGKNYLVDVTNCDAGTVGYPDKLFLAGYDSGSAKDGYVVYGVNYTYDDPDMFNLFGEDALTLSSASYASEAPSSYAVTVVGGTASPAQAAEGETVTVTLDAASIPEGQGFAGWDVSADDLMSGDGDGYFNPYFPVSSFRMPGQDLTLTASYQVVDQGEYTLNLTDGEASGFSESTVGMIDASLKPYLLCDYEDEDSYEWPCHVWEYDLDGDKGADLLSLLPLNGAYEGYVYRSTGTIVSEELTLPLSEEDINDLRYHGNMYYDPLTVIFGKGSAVDLEAELRAALASEGTYTLTETLTLTADLAIPYGAELVLRDPETGAAGHLIIPDGVTVNNSDMITADGGGTITVRSGGRLDNYDQLMLIDGGKLVIEDGGCVMNNGTIACSLDSVYGELDPDSCGSIEYFAKVYDGDQAALQALYDAGYEFVLLFGDIAITSDFTLPDGGSLQLSSPATLTVAEGTRFTNLGGIIIYSGTMLVSGTLDNEGTISVYPDGTLTVTGTFTGDPVINYGGTVDGAPCDDEHEPGSMYTEDGIAYEITENNTVTITGYDEDLLPAVLAIPAEIEEYPVTAIGEDAFSDCSALTSVTIPASVQSIGDWAFSYCKNLKSVTIPEGVTDIGIWAFDSTGLTGVTIPASVQSIGAGAFASCRALQQIEVDPENTYYSSDGGVLFNKDKTALVQLPGGYTGSYVIPADVSGISNCAFCGCSSLTDVTIPEGVTSIGLRAFVGCTGLTSVTIPEGVASIGLETFYGCASLESVTIPESVQSIAEWAFSRCASLKSVTIPGSVQSIGQDAFSQCTGLESVMISEGVQSFDTYVFEGCDSLTGITIPASVTSIGVGVFTSCPALQQIEVDPENAYYSSDGGVLFNKDKTTLVQFPGGYSGSYTVPETVTRIDEWSFTDCGSLESITFPVSVQSIGGYAFQSSAGLKSVTFAAGVRVIEEYAFSNCDALESITFEHSADAGLELGEDAFRLWRDEEEGDGPAATTIYVPDPADINPAVSGYDWEADNRTITYEAIPTVDTYVVTVVGGTASPAQAAEGETVTVTLDAASIPASYGFDGWTVTGLAEDEALMDPEEEGLEINVFRPVISFKMPGHPITLTAEYSENARGEYELDLSQGDVTVYAESGAVAAIDAVLSGYLLTEYADQREEFDGENYIISADNFDWPCYVWVYDLDGDGEGDLLQLYPYDWEEPEEERSVYHSTGTIGRTLTLALSAETIADYRYYGREYYNPLVVIFGEDSHGGDDEYSYTEDGIRYEIDGDTVTITGYDEALLPADLVIPAEIEGYPVTAIGESAFGYCTGLRSVTIPASVTDIGNGVFASCRALQQIEVDPENEYYSTDGIALFDKNKTTLVQFPGVYSGAYTIPGSVTGISSYAFWGCSSLTNVTIPESVTSISSETFAACENLTAILVDENNSYYSSDGVSLFSKDMTELIRVPTGLRGSYAIPAGVESIGEFAFDDCESLTNVTIPESITSIGQSAFNGCSSLTSVSIPESVTNIGGWAFYFCTSLTCVNIPASVTSISNFAFGWCTDLTSVTIPANVASIGIGSFGGCSSLTEIRFLHTADSPLNFVKGDIGAFVDWDSETLLETTVLVPDPTNVNPAISGYDWAGDNRTITYEAIPAVNTYAVTVIGGTASPAQAAEGETVTVTLDAASIPAGKAFGGWRVMGLAEGEALMDGEDNDAEFISLKAVTTFKMPGHAVTLTATYYENALGEYTLDVSGDGVRLTGDLRTAITYDLMLGMGRQPIETWENETSYGCLCYIYGLDLDEDGTVDLLQIFPEDLGPDEEFWTIFRSADTCSIPDRFIATFPAEMILTYQNAGIPYHTPLILKFNTSPAVDREIELRTALAEDGEYILTDTLTLSSNLEIQSGQTLYLDNGLEAGHLIIPDGVTVTVANEGRISGHNGAVITVKSGGQILCADGFMLMGGGKLFIEAGGYVECGYLSCDPTTIQGEGTFDGYPVYQADLPADADEAAFRAALDAGYTMVDLHGDLTITSDLTVPEYCNIHLVDGITFTVAAGAAVTNLGYISIDASTLRVLGTFDNTNGSINMMADSTIDNQGTWQQNGNAPISVSLNDWVNSAVVIQGLDRSMFMVSGHFFGSIDETLLAEMLQSGPDVIDGMGMNQTLTRDLTIPEGTALVLWGGSLTVPAGVTLTVNGQLTLEEGTIIVEGAYVGNPVNLYSGTVDGAPYVIPGQDPSENTEEALRAALAETGEYTLTGALTLSADLEIEDWQHLYVNDFNTGETGHLIIPGGVTVTNRGLINANNGAAITVQAGGRLINYNQMMMGGGKLYIEAGGSVESSGYMNGDPSTVEGEGTFDGYMEFAADLPANGTQADLQALLDAGYTSVTLHGDMTIASDMTLPEGCGLHVTNLTTLTVAEGAAFANRGFISIYDGTMIIGGTLANDGDIYVFEGGVLTVMAAGSFRGSPVELYEGGEVNNAPYKTPGQEEFALEWRLSDDGRTAVITGYSGEMLFDLVIPETIDGYPVTAIDGWAFYQCNELTSLTLPESVTFIGDNAFHACRNLASVVILADDVTFGNNPFGNCPNLTTAGPIGGGYDFEFAWTDCIPDHAFQGCRSLSSVTLPETLTAIGDLAFHMCNDLWPMDLPAGLESIGSYAFCECYGLTEIVFPEGLQTIGDRAFYDSGLTRVVIPKTVRLVDTLAFGFCADLTAIEVDGENPYYTNDEKGVLFNKDRSVLLQVPGAMTGTYRIPETVTTVKEYAFSGSHLACVVIPKNVTEIVSVAFLSCEKLKEIRFEHTPEDALTIGSQAFQLWKTVNTTVYAPDAENLHPAIANYPWAQEDRPVTYESSSGVTADGLTWALLDDGTVAVTGHTGALPANLVLPDEIEGRPVTSISESAFENCDTLERITIPASVSVVGSQAFAGCAALAQVTFLHETGDELTLGEDSFATGSAEDLIVSVVDTDNVPEAIAEAFDTDQLVTTLPLPRLVLAPVGVTPQWMSLNGNPTDNASNALSCEVRLDKAAEVQSFGLAYQALISDGNEVSLTNKQIKYTSTDTRIATVKVNPDGTAIVTIKANADGACTITATATLDGQKVEGSIAVYVREYTPRLESTSVTVNSWCYYYEVVRVIPGYENEITSTEVDVADTRFEAFYDFEEGILLIRPNGQMKNGKYKTTLTVQTEKGPKDLSLTIVVKNAAPSVYVAQWQKINTFYKDSEAIFYVSAPGLIGNVSFETATYASRFDAYDEYSGELHIWKKADAPAKVAASGTLTVEVEGFDKLFTKKITVKAETVKPYIRLSGKSFTVNTAYGEKAVMFDFVGELPESEPNITVSPVGAANVSYSDGTFTVTEIAKKATATITVQDPNWTAPMTFKVTLNVNGKLPVAKPAVGTLLLNAAEAYHDLTASTRLTLNTNDVGLIGDFTELTPTGKAAAVAQAEKLLVAYQDGEITASIRDSGNLPAPGTYSFQFTPKVYNPNSGEPIDLKPVTVKVKVSDNPVVTATVKAKGKLDAVQRDDSWITYTVTKLDNLSGDIIGAEVIGPDAGLFDVWFWYGAGLGGADLTLKPDVPVSTKASYKIALEFTVESADGGTFTARTKTLTVKVTQSKLKLAVYPKTATLFQGQDTTKPAEFELVLDAPWAAQIKDVKLNTTKTPLPFQRSLGRNAVVTWEPDAEYGGYYGVVKITVKDPSKVVNGKSYKVVLDVIPEGCATNVKPTSVTVTVKVKK